jgi:hypothetical protein
MQNPYPIYQKPNQIHSESIKNTTKPWIIYQIHIMIPAIRFQEFTIGMLTTPLKKTHKFRVGVLLLGSLHYIQFYIQIKFYSLHPCIYIYILICIIHIPIHVTTNVEHPPSQKDADMKPGWLDDLNTSYVQLTQYKPRDIWGYPAYIYIYHYISNCWLIKTVPKKLYIYIKVI